MENMVMLHMNDVAISYSYVWPLRQNVDSGMKREMGL